MQVIEDLISKRFASEIMLTRTIGLIKIHLNDLPKNQAVMLLHEINDVLNENGYSDNHKTWLKENESIIQKLQQ